jgi:hypothetical protein
MGAKSTLLEGEVGSLTVLSHKEVSGTLLGIRPTVTAGANPGRPMWVFRFAEGTFNVLESTDFTACPGNTAGVGGEYHCVWDGPKSKVEPLNMETGEVSADVVEDEGI